MAEEGAWLANDSEQMKLKQFHHVDPEIPWLLTTAVRRPPAALGQPLSSEAGRRSPHAMRHTQCDREKNIQQFTVAGPT